MPYRFSTQGWVLFVTEAETAKQVLSRPDKFPKGTISQGPLGCLLHRFVGGENIVFSNGQTWRKHRRKSLPIELFGRLTSRLLLAMERSENTVNVVSLFEALGLDVLGNAGFGLDFMALVNKESKWVSIYNRIRHGLGNVWFYIIPYIDTKFVHWFSHRKAVHEDLTEFHNMLDQMIEDKRKKIAEKESFSDDGAETDLLTAMLESQMIEGGGLSNDNIKDIQERMRNEAISILGDELAEVVPTIDQIKQMKYIDMVIKEAARMHPPILNLPARIAREDCFIGGTFVPKDTHLTVDMRHVMRNPRVWKDPDVFDPERFASGGEAEQLGPYAYVPFGGGGRICLGKKFSIALQAMVLSMMLRKYTWHLPDDSVHKSGVQEHGVGFGMVTIHDLNIQFKKRY
ncbi:cytochrome P450-dit2 [Apophysomyces ossiformis]|uniref:Cytochrome P450-dit2 n=1 Tax=Apophysomyces ossiformis TaxID=679940 RepID=A0A8H7BK39_9FUNG|nr:cytochrome P450-dit2 [Apophysomyces ossiformis]